MSFEPRTGSSQSIAARMGRWSAQHRKTAIFGWLAFVVLAVAIGAGVGTNNLKQGKSGSGESGHVESTLTDHFKQHQRDAVLIQSSTLTVDDARFKAAIDDVVRTAGRVPQVRDLQSPLGPGRTGEISKDRHSARVVIELRTTDPEKAKTIDGPVAAALTAAGTRHPGIAIEEFGGNSMKQFDDAVSHDFAKAGEISLPVTLVVLVIAFGALVAAGLPLLLALTAVAATTGLLALPSKLMPIDPQVGVIVLLIGLAVGVDYAMFYLKREREERAAGRSPRAAVEAAAATSGHAVMVSGLTVIIAMAGMLFTGDKTFMSFGLGAMIVVAVAVLGSLTVLPASMSLLGDRVEKVRVPFVHRLSGRGSTGRAWGRFIDAVLRRPILSMTLAGGFLLALAAPALQLHIASPGNDTLPKSLSAVRTYLKIEKAFPQTLNEATVMVRTPHADSPTVTAALAELEHRALATGKFSAPVKVDHNPAGTIALLTIGMQGSGVDAEATSALHTLRGTLVPATVGRLPEADVGVAGQTAAEYDSNRQMSDAAPWVFAFVLVLAFMLMLVTFRSIVIAIKAVLLNLLSVAAAYGALVLVFQRGWGKHLLGFEKTGGIVGFLPIFLFVILFGLSMDYHVFILTRIREAYDRGMPTDKAVAHGIRTTAGVVTSAAIVMVGVFSIFATLQFMFLKQFGVGLAVAVLVDATVVRAVLLPATMKLLGKWNWYLPRWLGWLPRTSRADAARGRETEPPADTRHDLVGTAAHSIDG
jgi:RND superfamily putative drug exporter